jgi:hypothetical protein
MGKAPIGSGAERELSVKNSVFAYSQVVNIVSEVNITVTSLPKNKEMRFDSVLGFAATVTRTQGINLAESLTVIARSLE